MDKSYNIQDIMKLLPHRYPFLLIDRVIELKSNEKIVALKNVTISEPFFQGHFPGDPVMPGVLIIEAMGQAGGILAADSLPKEKQGSSILFMGMDKVKFRKPVVPGDQLIFEVQFLRKRAMVFKMSGVAYVNKKRVAEAELMATFEEKP